METAGRIETAVRIETPVKQLQYLCLHRVLRVSTLVLFILSVSFIHVLKCFKGYYQEYIANEERVSNAPYRKHSREIT